MTITYNLGPQNKWRFYYTSNYSTLAQTPLVGGLVYTYEAANHATLKTTYSSNIGSPPPSNTNPIVLDANGEASVYGLFDDTLTNLQNEYYIEVRDAQGVLIYSFDDYAFSPIASASSSTTNSLTENYTLNPQFYWNHYGKPTAFKLNNSYTLYTGCYISDEWLFTKNNTSATETLTLTAFSAGQTSVPFQPANYLNWTCTGAGAAESFKNIFQTTAGSQSFSTQTIWIQFWAMSTTNMPLTVNFRQHFGTSGASSDVVSVLMAQTTINSSWTFYVGSLTVPSVAGKTITAGDTVQVEFALRLNHADNLALANIGLTIGATAPSITSFPYETNNIVQSKLTNQQFIVPTGSIQYNFTASTPLLGFHNWIILAGNTIGNTSSGSTPLADENLYPLFAYFWNNVSNTFAPVSTGRGASAIADFDANKTLTMPTHTNRFPVGAGGTYAPGETAAIFAAGAVAGLLAETVYIKL